MMRNRGLQTLVALLLVALAGCSSYRNFRRAEMAEVEGDWDQAVAYYMQAVDEDPTNISYRAALLRAKIRASQEHFEKGKRYREAGVLNRAQLEFQQAVQLDPTNQYAQVELRKVREDIEMAESGLPPATTIDELKARTRGIRPQPPQLNPRSTEPIDLEFPQPVSVKDIYKSLGKAFGINILFDPNLKDQDLAIVLKQVTAQDGLEILMRSAGHFYKVLDEHTIIVVADTPQNRRNYEDLVLQTFFLSNADPKEMMTMLRSLVDAKKLATNEQLNAIILRDTADKVKIAERLIQTNDKSRAEVVVDVELLQINTNSMRELGLSLSSYSVTQTLDLGGDDIPLRVSDLGELTTNNWTLTIPNFIYNFVKQAGDAQLLARPQLRISEGEKARLLIGERVPIPTTTFNTSNTTGGGAIVPVTSFQYTEVGIQIEIEPRVHHNKEITLVIKVEVSDISGFETAANGQRQPRIGTRTIETTIRLKDGETNFLAGLIRTNETSSEQGVPGLSDIPVLGRLFSNNSTNADRTDVILTMTPHIIRTPDIEEEDLLPIWVGTESNITFRGGSPRVESDVEGPFDGEEPDAERLREMIRQRIQRLPQGLRQQGAEPDGGAGAGENEEPPPPTSIDLAPSRPPTSIFQRERQEEQEEEPPSDSARLEAPLPDVRPAAAAAALDIRPAADRSAPLPPGGSAPVTLRLVPPSLIASPGDRFEVAVVARADEPVAHLPLKLVFDPAVVEVESVEAGGFLGAEGEAEVLADTSRPGELLLGASRLGRDGGGASGTGTLARVTFRAIAAGATAIRFTEATALNGDLAPLAGVAAAPATVEVDTAAAPPAEPGGPRGRGPLERPPAV